jgi:hypothetical protein
MGLLSFLTGVSSLFGGSDGKKQNTSTNQNQNSETAQTGKTTTTGTINSGTVASGSSTQTGSQTTSGKSTGTVAESTKGTTTATGTEKTQTTDKTSQYSSEVLASLDSLLMQSLGSGTAQQATDALQGRLNQVKNAAAAPAFDTEGYVAGIANAAMARTQDDLDSRINSMLSATGSSESGNSMAALLGNRMRNDAAANLAGIVSNATAQGQQIAQSEQESLTSQISGLSNDLAGQLQNLLGVAKGGQSTSVGTGQATTAQSTANQQQSNQSSTATENVNQSTKSTATEQTKSDTKQTESGTTDATQVSQTNVNTKTNTKTKDGKDLFGNILEALGKSSAAA